MLPPSSFNVRNYLSRMHLTDGLGSAVDLSLPDIRENPLRDRLIPLLKLDADGPGDFDDHLGDLLDSDDMRHAGYLAEVIAETASEMVLNAIYHGENATGAYLAAQRFDNGRRCIVAVGDMGIGMAEHLRRGGQGRETDAATIAHGMSDMVSGTGDEYRGRGYSVPFEVAREKSATFARLRVRANDGWVQKHDDHKPIKLNPSVACDAGTWVEFEFGHADTPN